MSPARALPSAEESALPCNRILEGDCVALMRAMPSACVDAVFADPPYYLQLDKALHRPDESRVLGVEESWDKFESFAAYDSFSRAWLSEARRVLKPHGSLWVMGSYHNIYRLGTILQDLDFWILNDIVWVKRNPMPNFHGRRFTNAHETLLWCARAKGARHRFNYRALKRFNDDRQMRSDWHLPLCTGAERLKDEQGRKLHPTQKPEALLYRVVLACTHENDILLDPFCGSGTSAAVCRRLGRRYLGIERDPLYVRAARERLSQLRPPSSPCVTWEEPRAWARAVPFSALLESGLLSPGDVLESYCQRFEAQVTADAALFCEQTRGSIHQVAAHLAGRDSCNGWTYWRCKGKKNVPLDDLRKQLRAMVAAAEASVREDMPSPSPSPSALTRATDRVEHSNKAHA